MPAAGPRQPPTAVHRQLQHEAAQKAAKRAARQAAIRRDLRAARQQTELHRQQSLHSRALLEHASLLRGLLLLAVAALTFALIHAGLHRSFVPGWWRQW